MTHDEQIRRFGYVPPEQERDGWQGVFAGLATAALVALTFAATVDHWMTEHNAARVYQEQAK